MFLYDEPEEARGCGFHFSATVSLPQMPLKMQLSPYFTVHPLRHLE